MKYEIHTRSSQSFLGSKMKKISRVSDEKHMMPKTSAISVMITEVKKDK